jgi:hypothetical protein
MFQVAVVGSAQTGFSIAALWGKIASVPNPGPSPALPRVEAMKVALSPAAVELQEATFGTQIAAGLLTLFGGTSRMQTLKKDIEKKAAEARLKWNNLKNSWAIYTSSKGFQDIWAELHSLRSRHDGLPQKKIKALQELETNRYKLQLHAHLDRCRISHGRIKGIGDTRKASLQSYGIETAVDITDQRILNVPGFGPVAANNLMQWRRQQERKFVFDANKAVAPAARNAVERLILAEKFDLERKLNEGLSKLTIASHHILARRRTLLAQAEEAAQDLAQAEADLRTAARASPITVPWKWAIVALAGASVGSWFIATHETKGPAPAPTPPIYQLRQVLPPIVSPVPSPGPTLPPHVEQGINGQLRPQDGYDWTDAKRTSVRWMPGKASRQNPHVVASNTEGDWEPEDGYTWVDRNNPKDKSIRWVPGTPSNKHQNVVAGLVEGQWRPADGYAWVLNPPRPGDMRVKPVPKQEDQNSFLVPVNPFQLGLSDRAELEQWVAGLSGDFRRGVDWWAARRSLPNAGTCAGAPGASPDVISGCEAAKARLTPMDQRRNADPAYRRGWNTYTSPVNTTVAPAQPPIAPTATEPSRSPENDDSAARLNAQQLKRPQGR